MLAKLGKLPESKNIKTLSDFNDVANISDYAKDALKTFVEAGIVQGSGNKLNPKATATRAEAVQILYNKYIAE